MKGRTVLTSWVPLSASSVAMSPEITFGRKAYAVSMWKGSHVQRPR